MTSFSSTNERPIVVVVPAVCAQTSIAAGVRSKAISPAYKHCQELQPSCCGTLRRCAVMRDWHPLPVTKSEASLKTDKCAREVSIDVSLTAHERCRAWLEERMGGRSASDPAGPTRTADSPSDSGPTQLEFGRQGSAASADTCDSGSR